MSTRSCIILKLREGEKGKEIKFDRRKVNVEHWCETQNNINDVERSEKVKLTGKYIGVYCHWDGYLEGIGAELKEHFTDYDSVLNLLSGGFISSISNGRVRHYANREGEDWKYIKPIQGSSAKSIYSKMTWIEYVYLFDGDTWKVLKGGAFKEY